MKVVGDGGGNTATYSYLANSPLVSQILFQRSGATRMTITKQFDYINRLLSVSSAPSAASGLSFSYQYNDANQRCTNTLAGSSYWVYSYDTLGQVLSGKRYWADGTPVAGQQFEYTFDDIGNRKTASFGGDDSGANLRSGKYGCPDRMAHTKSKRSGMPSQRRTGSESLRLGRVNRLPGISPVPLRPPR
jgi:hypothetical protein